MAKDWPTPVNSTGAYNRGGGPNRAGKIRPSLRNMAPRWQTPRVNEAKCSAYQYDQGDHTKPRETLTGQAYSHQAQTTPLGPKSSPSGRTLNPQFVAWLMGWPPSWPIVTMRCGSREMASWRSRQQSLLQRLRNE